MSDLPSQQRQKGESAKAHQAYLDYRDMGVSRSHRKLIEMYADSHLYTAFCKMHNRDIALYKPHNPPSTAKSTTVIENWSSKFKWQERIAAWDKYLQDERERQESDARLKERDRRGIILEKLRAKIDAQMRHADLSTEDGIKAFNAISKAVTSYMTLSMKQYNDLPTEKKDITTDGKPLAVNFVTTPISDDEVQKRLKELGLDNFVNETDE